MTIAEILEKATTILVHEGKYETLYEKKGGDWVAKKSVDGKIDEEYDVTENRIAGFLHIAAEIGGLDFILFGDGEDEYDDNYIKIS